MSNGYGDIIESVFFGKLKTALVIDDEYPTMDQLACPEKEPTTMDDDVTSRFGSLMASLRAVQPPLLVDFHDGQTDADAEIVERFYQSDFLVLDWQLAKANPKYEPSLRILREIFENGYFNIVVIDSTEESGKILKRILRTFSKNMTSIDCETLSDIELPDGIDPDAIANFLDDGDIGDFLLGRSNATKIKGLVESILKDRPQEFLALLSVAGEEADTAESLLNYVIAEQILGFEPQERTGKFLLESRFDRSKSRAFIKTDGAFISITLKKDNQNPVDVAKATMKSAGFRPEELMLAGLRNEISEKGVKSVGQVSGFKHASALWYYRLLNADKKRGVLLDRFVSSHADAMIEVVKPTIVEIGHKIVESDICSIQNNAEKVAKRNAEIHAYHLSVRENGGVATEGVDKPEPVAKLKPETICKKHYAVELENEADVALAVDQHNFLANCRPVRGTHLTNGHVFKLDEEYWVCVTPACTMEPGRPLASQARLTDPKLVDGSKRSTDYHYLPIRMECLMLHPIPQADQKGFREKAGEKYFVILEEANSLVMLGVKKDKGGTTKMQTESFHVDQGSWRSSDASSTVELWLSRLHAPEINDAVGDADAGEAALEGSLKNHPLRRFFSEKREVTVIGSLRPEYAASLSRRVAVQSSEIGLDYLPSNKNIW